MKNVVNKILKESPDPLQIRSSTAGVVNNLELIEFDFKKLDQVVEIVKKKYSKKEVLTADQFGSEKPTPQLIFILDVINFCFWAGKDQEKWTVEYPKSNFIANGWYGLVASVERAQKESTPILETDFLEKLTLKRAKHIFRSANNQNIPLLEERVRFLNQVGRTLKQKYQGNIYHFLSSIKLDANIVGKKLLEDFPSFEDCATWRGKRINFYKRVQIFVYDLSLLPSLKVKNLEVLTVFADYKIPQILRAFGVIKYHPRLAKKVDNYQLLKLGSGEEIEIRSATIWAGELIAHKAGMMPVEVDNVLWKVSQSIRDIKPYHRVLTTSY